LDETLADQPAIPAEGPRGSGKSTILRRVAARRDAAIVDLDDEQALAVIKRVVDREGGTSWQGRSAQRSFHAEPKRSPVFDLVAAGGYPGRCSVIPVNQDGDGSAPT